MLRHLTGFAIRRPVLVVLLWTAVLVGGFGVGVGVFESLVADVGSVPGSEAERAADRLDAADPQPERITAVIHGRSADDPVVRSEVAAAAADIRAMPGIAEVTPPLASTATGQALLMQVTLHAGQADSDVVAQAAAHRLTQITAAEVTVAGGPLTEDEFGAQAQSDVQRAELISMPVLLVLLLLIFGGLIAAGLPLLIATVGVGATFGVLYGFSLIGDVSVYAIQVTTMLSIGLAVDYALLMVSRFREERRQTADVRDAVGRTMASAGRTVMFSGLTVAVALAGLLVFPDPFLRSMGLAGAAVVLINMLAALTLLPALLTLVGRRIKPTRRAAGVGFFGRVAAAVQRRPIITIAVTTGALVVLALPLFSLRLSEGDARMLPTTTATRQMYDVIATHFPERGGPEPIVVVASSPVDDPAVTALRERITAFPAITRVEVDEVGPRLTVLRTYTAAVPATGESKDVVAAIRDLPSPVDVQVTGQAARLVDYEAMLAERAPWAAGAVALATFILLFLFTGSVLLPVKAILTNLLSIGAALGVVVWVFQQGHLVGLFGSVRLADTNLTVPVLVAAIAFGLSVDYEVFLLSRIRERWLAGVGANRAVSEGVQLTGRIITSAALLLVVVFGGFLVGGFAPIKEIGLGLVLAIAIDATVVRMLLVPATMTVLGRFNWWLPAPLSRLHRRLAVSETPPEAPAVAPVPVAAR